MKRLAIIIAVLATVAGLASFSGYVELSRAHATPAARMSTMSPSAHANQLVLGSVDFLNPSLGWITMAAKTGRYVRVFHTVDGGRTWQAQVAIRRSPGFDPSTGLAATGLDFVDRDHGFLWISGSRSFSRRLLRTGDGGKTWTALPLPAYLRGQTSDRTFEVDFVDRSHGWILGAGGEAMGWESADVAATTTAGKTWIHVASAAYQLRSNFGGIGMSGFKENIEFTGRRNGWIFGAVNAGSGSPNWLTTDGGRHWRAHELARPPLPGCPAKATEWNVTELSPARFWGQRGLLPVALKGTYNLSGRTAGGAPHCHRPGFFIESLNRAGASWGAPHWIRPPISATHSAMGATRNAVAYLASPRTWYFASGPALTVTTNSGRNWSKRSIVVQRDSAVAGMRFLGSRNGLLWASRFNPNTTAYATSPILKSTTNGGASWLRVQLP